MNKTVTLISFGMLLLLACRKVPDLSQLSSNFVVQTSRAPDADFNAYKTFYISDTIGYISTNPNDSILTDDAAKQLVAEIRGNLEARGYRYVPKIARPDIGVNVLAVKDIDVGVVYPGWWWGYPGYWDPWYWGWYYPYYYPWSVAYSVTTGSVIADLVDLKHADDNQKLEVVWTMNLNGALGSSTNSNLQRALDGVDQAFTQSPYLLTNN